MAAKHNKQIVKWADALAEKYNISTDLVYGLLDEQYGYIRSVTYARQCTETFLRLYFEGRNI